MIILESIVLVPPSPRTDRHRLAGTVTVDGVPAQRTIVIVNRISFVVYAMTMSDPITGVWAIKGLPEFAERSLLVLALDNTGNYNAEVADYISQVTA